MADDKINLATSVPKDFLEAFGAVGVNFSALENALSLCVWFLLGDASALTQERHQIVTAQLSFRQLVWMVVNLYRDRFPGKNEETIESYRKQCFQAEEKRNAITHSLWVDALPGEGEPKATRLKLVAQKRFELRAEEHTKSELIEIANTFCQLAYNLQSFIIGEVVTEASQSGDV